MIKKYSLEIAVFICGAVVMVFELTGSRVLAPFLGTSIYVWSSLIGVILGSLSAGYWYGGKVADKGASLKYFSAVIFISGVLIGATAAIKDIVPFIFYKSKIGLEISSILSSLILFAPASFLLGIISPYAVKLKTHALENTGQTVGNLYALSTLGSIAGTFLAGFFLIPFFGSTKIIFLLAAVLVLLSAFLTGIKNIKSFPVVILIIVALVSWLGSSKTVLSIDTQYNRIMVAGGIDAKTGKETLSIAFDPYGTQSAMFLDSDELVFDYLKYYRLATHFNEDAKKFLMIGGCAYSYPKDFLNNYKEATLDVVEIDPVMTEIARKYFRLKDDPRLNIYHEDGRVFFNTTANKYDVILGDAFNSFSSTPFHLATREAVQKQYDILNEGGVVVLNIISAVEGEKGEFARAEYHTFKSVFPQVYLFPVQHQEKSTLVQNVMLVAIKSDSVPKFISNSEEINNYLSHVWTGEIPQDNPILTDDFAPVEHYKKKMM